MVIVSFILHMAGHVQFLAIHARGT